MGRVDWWFVARGIVVVLCGIFAFLFPWLFLEFLTVLVGVGFVVSGIVGAITYPYWRKVQPDTWWTLLMAILDIVVGVLLIAEPFTFAHVIPWLPGFAFVIIGIAGIIGALPFAHYIPESRLIMIISGILTIIIGVAFIVWPASLSIWVAAFALVRGVTLIVMGLTLRGR